MNPLRVLIVGCGNIAGRFDEGRPPGEPPVTHAGAYTRDGKFVIAACVDPDRERRGAYAQAWKVPLTYASLDEVRNAKGQFDVISICSPTRRHAEDVELALRLGPKLVFCEKPVTSSAASTRDMIEKCTTARIPLAVNYTRRWDPEIAALQARMRTGELGTLRAIAGVYNKGLLNNGSHMVDLLHMLVGPMKVVGTGKPVADFSEEDPTIPVWLEGPNELPIHLMGGHAADFAFFEAQLIFEHGVVTMEDGGAIWRERRAQTSALFKGYRTLSAGEHRPGGYAQAMLAAARNIHGTVSRGDPLASTGESALAAQRLCEAVKQTVTSHRIATRP